jgi:hypothetical protein
VPDDRCDLLCLDLPRAEAIPRNRLPTDRAELLAGRAGGLADPTRLMLAAALLDAGELCVCDLSWISGRAANLVSHQRERRLLRERRTARRRSWSAPGPPHHHGRWRGDPRANVFQDNK